MNPALERAKQIKELMTAVKTSSDPSAMLSQLAIQNEGVRNAMGIVQQYNGNAKEAFFALAKQRGIDPAQIISILK